MKTCMQVWLLACILASGGAAVAAPSQEDAANASAARIAAHYGVQDFGRVETLRFTFNARIGEKQVRRGWTWRPATGEVTYEGLDPAGQPIQVRYRRDPGGAPGPDAPPGIDAWFVNDQYWLLFPLHLAWDAGLQLARHADRPLPLGGGSAERLEVGYPQGVGYTPGDLYELFTDPRGRLIQWIYRKGGAAEPTRIATWEEHRRVGPLLLALLHRGADESFRLWFSDVALRLRGGSEWLAPGADQE
jgi:hypothetical protein